MRHISKKGFAFLIAVGTAFVMLFVPSEGFAQEEQWSRPVSVSGFISGSEFPTLAVDGSGNVHVLWYSVEGDQGSSLYYSRWDGEAWTRPVDISFGGERSVISVDGFGELNLLYLNGGRATYARADGDQATNSKGWIGQRVLNETGATLAIQMAIDEEGVIHVVRTQSSGECAICSNVLYQHSTDGGQTWSEPVTLSIQPADRVRVQLRIDSHDRLHVAWDGLGAKGDNQSVRYTYSTDHGNTWPPAQQFFGPRGLPTQSAIGIAGNDQLVLLWQTTDHDFIYYQLSDDGGITWDQPTLLPNMTPGQPSTGNDDYFMVVDSAGILHLAAVGRGTNPDVPSLYHLQWDGKSWSKPDVVYSGPDFPEYPTMVLSNGNRLHLTWHTRGVDSITKAPGASSQVWYSTLLTSAPAVAPPSTFTPPPLPSPTEKLATPTPTPTETPPVFSDSNPASSADTGPLQQQISVLAGVIPALLLIGLVILIRSRPRRRI